MLTLAAGSEYTVTFGTINRPLVAELNIGPDMSVTQLIRYLDLTLPLSAVGPPSGFCFPSPATLL